MSFENQNHSEESKKKISESNKGQKRSQETKDKIGLSKKGNKYSVGRVVSNETKNKISESNKGKPAWNKGKRTKTDEEIKQQRAEYHKKRYQEDKERIRMVQKEYESKPETKQKKKEYSKVYRHENKEKIQNDGKNYLQRIKFEVMTHYSKGIPCCSNPNCPVPGGCKDIRGLSIDHINGGGNQHRKKMTANFYRWLINNGFPEGYQVLCMTCQFIKRHENNEVPGRFANL